MAILGVYDGHNACAAAISEETGEVVAAVEEERYSRIKNHDGRVEGLTGPEQSIDFCVRRSREPITRVALALAEPEDLSRLALNSYMESIRNGETARLDASRAAGMEDYDMLALPFRTQSRRLARCQSMLAAAGLSAVPIVHVRHHVAHAASAFLMAPMDRGLAIALDGMGDGLCGIIAQGQEAAIDTLARIDAAQSLGHLYSAFTLACGFQSLRHEGKITALAASGTVNDGVYASLADLFQFDSSRGALRGGLSTGLALGPYPHRLVAEHLDRVRKMIDGVSIEDAAATVQVFLEDTVSSLISHYLIRTAESEVVLAGGIFANVSLNLKVADLDGVDSMVVHPAMSDAGLAVGAAAYTFSQIHGRRPVPLPDVYLGPEYSDDEAVQAFVAAGYRIEESSDEPERVLARGLAAGQVVARFTGRAEYGPRALGNRSIFAPCDRPEIAPNLNKRLRRSLIMPFAPICAADEAPGLFLNLRPVEWSAKFMTVAVRCTERMREAYPAAVHVDGTARPQLVGPDNDRLIRLLRHYRELTGQTVLINTSLNIHDEPMALTPADAARCAATAGIDIVQVGGLVCVTKSRNVWTGAVV